MAPAVQGYFQEGLAPSTHRTYNAAMRQFHKFCTQFNVHSPFPVTEYLLCCYASFLANRSLTPQTINSYLSAVRNMQITLGLPDPREKSSLPMLKRVQAGIKRVRLMRGAPPRIRLPITASVLEKIRLHLNKVSHTHSVLIWSICCMAFFGFFRLGELLPESTVGINPKVHLMWGDVAIDSRDNPSMVRIHLKHSKCDQFGKGVGVVLGRSGKAICPVSAILNYCVVRGTTPGLFFIDRKGQGITKAWFIGQLRSTLANVGVPQNHYSGHSFRIGAATSAALAGVEDSTIQTLGRWHSTAFLQYIRMPRERLAQISAVLA